MGAGQIGGIATLLDIDFENAAGFIGVKATDLEAQFIVYYLSHAALFCAGVLIEPHVVITPATCVYGEKYKFSLYAGSHMFAEKSGTPRKVENICMHKSYNHTNMFSDNCPLDNVALLVLNKPYTFRDKEVGSDYIINRVRYGLPPVALQESIYTDNCHIYGWGSRRNGFLIPLLVRLRRFDVRILPCNRCHQMWNYGNRYLCIEEPMCKSSKFGALSPDDFGSPIVCNGFLRGIMVSRLIDRPAGVGFLDLANYHKFMTCGVDDARDVIHEHGTDFMVEGPQSTANPLTFATVPSHMTNQNKQRSNRASKRVSHRASNRVPNQTLNQVPNQIHQ